MPQISHWLRTYRKQAHILRAAVGVDLTCLVGPLHSHHFEQQATHKQQWEQQAVEHQATTVSSKSCSKALEQTANVAAKTRHQEQQRMNVHGYDWICPVVSGRRIRMDISIVSGGAID